MRHFASAAALVGFAVVSGCSSGTIDGGTDIGGSDPGSESTGSGPGAVNSTSGTSGAQPNQGGTGGSVNAGGSGAANAGGSAVMMPIKTGGSGCGLSAAAFCDTFETASPGGRAGDLDETKWSIARVAQYVAPPSLADA